MRPVNNKPVIPSNHNHQYAAIPQPTDQASIRTPGFIPKPSSERYFALETDLAMSVVVCTRDRPAHLERCLAAINRLDYHTYEVIVVDNAPQRESSAQIAAAAGARYIREDCPGLDWARNRGIAAAQHAIIAFTDDDTCVDPGWLKAIAANFADPAVMGVTGLVVPAELETHSQRLFEEVYGGMGRGSERRVLHGADMSERELLMAHTYGVGANMAFRRALFTAIGGFDVTLGVGTPSGGGDDNEFFHRVLAHGYTLVYEPAALMHHWHRREAVDLRRLVFNNGRTVTAFLLTIASHQTVRREAIVRFVLGFWLKYWLLGRLIHPHGFPRSLVVWELIGTLVGVPAYFMARSRARMLTNVRYTPSETTIGNIYPQ